MIWNNDWDLEDFGYEDEKGIVSIYTCSNKDCESRFEYVQKEKGEK